MTKDIIIILSNLRTKLFYDLFVMLNKQSIGLAACSTGLLAGMRALGNFTPPAGLSLPSVASPLFLILPDSPTSLSLTSSSELQSSPAPTSALCPLSLILRNEESEADNSRWQFVLCLLDVKMAIPEPASTELIHPGPRALVFGEEGIKECLN